MYFLGIDGGGSKTAYALANAKGNIISMINGETIHPLQIDKSEIYHRLYKNITKLCEMNNISIEDISYSVFGLPGYGEYQRSKSEIQKTVHRIFPKSNYKIFNDVVVGWAEGTKAKPGIHLVAGTGSVAYGEDKNGNTFRTGGWGPVYGDEGSAFWIGLRIIEVFTKQSDHRFQRDKVYSIIKERLELDKDFDILGKLENPRGKNRKDIAALCKLLCIEIPHNKYIKIIIEMAVKELALIIKGVYNKLDFTEAKEIIVSCSGGVFNIGNPIIEPLEQHLSLMDQRFKINVSNNQPVNGAVLLARKYFKEE